MLTNYALPAGVRLAGAVAVVLLAASPVWSQTSPSQDAGAQATEQQVVAVVDPVIAEVRRRLAEPARRDVHRGDRAALTAFYAARTGEPLWVTGSGLNMRAQDALAEIRKAEDWGLALAAFDLPRPVAADASPATLADAEILVGLAVLEYARHARGGRLDPSSLSANFDVKPPVLDPKLVLEAVSNSDTVGSYLIGLHPRHEQFQKLREALVKVRGGVSKPEPVAEILVKLPASGQVLKPGMTHADVALLRQRLKVPAEAGRETFYDPALKEAAAAFQRENKMTPDGVIGNRTRSVLNGNEPPKPALTGSETQRLIANMERWRWLPEELGAFHVWDNIPEFTARVLKNGQVIHTARIVVGKVENQTPLFSENMRYIVFQPEWGVPNGIKLKEIAPYLRSGGGGFFGFFGSDTSVLQRHNLRVSLNGKPVDPSSVNWDQVDIRRFSFIQPAGPSNVLGVVKFLFPNKHDVYMHDTSQRELFKQSVRAFSHGCMRVDNPGRLAELLLEEDKGWSAAHVQRLLSASGSSNEVELTRRIPVHITYFTAVAGDDGQVKYFGDIYGHDRRVLAALDGKALPMEVATNTSETSPANTPAKEPRKGKNTKQTSFDPFNGLVGN
ncbi:MAG: L,D-transpeptidase family protein [Hyphomicrobiaceae bacterium]